MCWPPGWAFWRASSSSSSSLPRTCSRGATGCRRGTRARTRRVWHERGALAPLAGGRRPRGRDRWRNGGTASTAQARRKHGDNGAPGTEGWSDSMPFRTEGSASGPRVARSDSNGVAEDPPPRPGAARRSQDHDAAGAAPEPRSRGRRRGRRRGPGPRPEGGAGAAAARWAAGGRRGASARGHAAPLMRPHAASRVDAEKRPGPAGSCQHVAPMSWYRGTAGTAGTRPLGKLHMPSGHNRERQQSRVSSGRTDPPCPTSCHPHRTPRTPAES